MCKILGINSSFRLDMVVFDEQYSFFSWTYKTNHHSCYSDMFLQNTMMRCMMVCDEQNIMFCLENLEVDSDRKTLCLPCEDVGRNGTGISETQRAYFYTRVNKSTNDLERSTMFTNNIRIICVSNNYPLKAIVGVPDVKSLLQHYFKYTNDPDAT